jgi:hypothetical protein
LKLERFGITSELAACIRANADQVDERALAHELADLLQLRALRLAKFRELHRKLKDAGFSIESALQMIKGQQIENFAITLEDFVTLCQGFDVPYNAEMELGPILGLLAVD